MDRYEFLELCSDYGGTTREMYVDCGQDIKEYHSWRALAERKECGVCGKVYFSADDDGCPYCK